MNIDKFKAQHVDILSNIAALRKLSQAGVADNAEEIARRIVSMSSTIKLHLAAEDRALYPAIERSAAPDLVQLSQQLQQEMAPIAQAYDGFARSWGLAARVRADEAGFRADANQVLRILFERMQRENRDFYPRIETQL